MAEGQSEHPLDEGLFVLSCWTLIWGPLIAVMFLHANMAFLLVTPGGLIAIFAGERKMGPVLLRYRVTIVALAAFFAGYCWYAYLEQNSVGFKTREAALGACSKFPSCIESARLYGSDVDIFPAQAASSEGLIDTLEKVLAAIKAMPTSPRFEDLAGMGVTSAVIQEIHTGAAERGMTPQQFIDAKVTGKQEALDGQP